MATLSARHDVRTLLGRLLKGYTMDEHPETWPFPQRGQRIRVLTGPFADFSGTVVDIDEFMRLVWVVILFFGRERSIGLDVLHVEVIP